MKEDPTTHFSVPEVSMGSPTPMMSVSSCKRTCSDMDVSPSKPLRLSNSPTPVKAQKSVPEAKVGDLRRVTRAMGKETQGQAQRLERQAGREGYEAIQDPHSLKM